MPKPVDEIRALVWANPVSALERLRRSGEAGLTRMGEASMLDEVVGQYADPAIARSVINENLTRERQIELVAARGDLPSSAAFVVDPEVVFEALLRELKENVGESDRAEDDFGGDTIVGHPEADPFVILAWAHKYRERDDWTELLDRVIGEYTVRDHLLIAIWNDAGCPQVFDEPPEATSHGEGDDEDDGEDEGPHGRLTDDLFDVVGLDSDEARNALSALISDGRAMRLSREAIDEAKSAIAERRRLRETAPLSSDAARGASEETKGELDI